MGCERDHLDVVVFIVVLPVFCRLCILTNLYFLQVYVLSCWKYICILYFFNLMLAAADMYLLYFVYVCLAREPTNIKVCFSWIFGYFYLFISLPRCIISRAHLCQSFYFCCRECYHSVQYTCVAPVCAW